MRNAMSVVVICAAVILLQPRSTLAAHDLTCHPPTSNPGRGFAFIANNAGGPGEELNLIVPGAGGATSTSCSGASGDTLPVVLPADLFSAIELVAGPGQPGRYWLFEPVSQAFLDDHIGLSAELPNFTKPDGTPLLAQYNESGLDFLLQAARDFDTGESLSASGGQIFAWPAATLREMPAAFNLDELFPPDPARFPLYSGLSQVADVAAYAVVPEPASWLLLLCGAMAIAGCRHMIRRS
jgi:hypothetical protein